MATTTIAVAGATGDLGFRIPKALIARNAKVIAIVRTSYLGNERYPGVVWASAKDKLSKREVVVPDQVKTNSY